MRIVLLSVLAACSTVAHAVSFDYHGSLRDAERAADGRYDFELTLYSASTGGAVIAGPLTLNAVPVRAGSFETLADFGPTSSTAGDAWLATRVRPAGTGEFETLAARTPVALAEIASVCPGAWTLAGNAGNPVGSYLGTADAQPLLFKVDGLQAGSLSPSFYADTPNVVFGSSTNSVTYPAWAATIGGGGSTLMSCGPTADGPCANTVSGNLATISGGGGNLASGENAVVSGGDTNTASGYIATVAGGIGNVASGGASFVSGIYGTASGSWSTVAGGISNVASGNNSFASGSYNTASGLASAALGGTGNKAGGDYSVAAGAGSTVRNASVTPGCTGKTGAFCGDYGTFVWSDLSSPPGYVSTGPNEFLIRATGGVAINQNDPGVGYAPSLSVTGLDTTRGTLFLASPKGPNASHVHFGPTGDWYIRSAASDGAVTIQDSGGITNIGNVGSPNMGTILQVGGDAAKPGGGSWATLSDARLKQNVDEIVDPLGRMLALHGVEFEYRPGSHALEPPGRQIGFIAQEVEPVFPDWVGTGDDGYKYVSVHGFEALTVESLRALRAEKDREIAVLRDQNAALQAQINQIDMRLQRVEAAREP